MSFESNTKLFVRGMLPRQAYVGEKGAWTGLESKSALAGAWFRNLFRPYGETLVQEKNKPHQEDNRTFLLKGVDFVCDVLKHVGMLFFAPLMRGSQAFSYVLNDDKHSSFALKSLFFVAALLAALASALATLVFVVVGTATRALGTIASPIIAGCEELFGRSSSLQV